MRAAVQKAHAMLGPAAEGATSKAREYAASLRPWTQFFLLGRPDMGPGLQRHVEENLADFKSNYVVIAATMFSVNLLSHPARLAALLAAAAAWLLLALRGGLDPEWRPRVGGVEVAPSHRLLLLSAASLLW